MQPLKNLSFNIPVGYLLRPGQICCENCKAPAVAAMKIAGERFLMHSL
jgi:hypothetical protein